MPKTIILEENEIIWLQEVIGNILPDMIRGNDSNLLTKDEALKLLFKIKDL